MISKSDLLNHLASAYAPCSSFANVCSGMRWNPSTGHVPRGFCGAIAGPEHVRLILVCAEPGDPHAAECYVAPTAEAILDLTYNYSYECFKLGSDKFHRNVRHILDLCFPNLTFDEQMRMTWITDTVLCSAEIECGPISKNIASACRQLYLDVQLAAMPQAVVVALGGKARTRLKGLNRDVLYAYHPSPPGCNYRGALPSWQALATDVRARFGA